MGIKKVLKKFKQKPPEMTISEIHLILSFMGFSLNRTKGSHFIFQGKKKIFVIPVHNNKVKESYIKIIHSYYEKNY